MDGKSVTALVYDRANLKAGNLVKGPAIVMEMDSTTVILPKHLGKVDALGNILIYPDKFKPRKSSVKARPTPTKPARK
jgi:N-methylhydantoinase A